MTAATTETKFHCVTPDGILKDMPDVSAALAAAKAGGYVWLDYCEPKKEDLAALVGPLGIHPLAIEDCFDDNQIPKLDDYPRHALVLFNAFIHSGTTLTISEVDVFIGANFLVTVSGITGDGHRVLDGIDRVVEVEKDNIRQGPSFLLHVILDWVVDRKFVAIEAIEEDINHAEEAMLADVSRFGVAQLLRLRRDLLSVRKILFHEREVMVKICRKDCPFITDSTLFFYRDIYDHLSKFFELTESSRDIVTSLMEMYLSLLNNRMALVANETNTAVRRLTFITTIFMPLTLLAGIGGMSEWSMMTGPANWKIAYPAFLAGMVVIGMATYYILKKFEKKKLRGDRHASGGFTPRHRAERSHRQGRTK